MKNKSLLLKFCAMVFVAFCFSFSSTSAILFHLNVDMSTLTEEEFKKNILPIHFADNGNDFGGFFYFSDGGGTVGGAISTQSDPKGFECDIQQKGFYYNAQRGERLWPLDEDTRDKFKLNDTLTMSGGIYTMCSRPGYDEALVDCEDGKYKNIVNLDYDVCVEMVDKEFSSDGLGYYGELTQTYSGQNFGLVMGVDYAVPVETGEFISIQPGSKLSSTFIRLDNKYPIGFLYDYNGGVGLAGCKFIEGQLKDESMRNLIKEASGDLLNIFQRNETGVVYSGVNGVTCNGTTMSLEDTLNKILVEGIVGIDGVGTGGAKKFGSLGNSSDAKMQYFGTKSVSNIMLMNYIAKKSESLCRGKWKNGGNPSTSDGIICWNGGSVGTGVTSYARKNGKTLIVKNGDATISPITGNIMAVNDNAYYDIYLLSGNLIIDEREAGKYAIEMDGFISDNQQGLSGFNAHAILKSGRSKGDFAECTGNIQFDPACGFFDLDGNNEVRPEEIDSIDENWQFAAMASVIKGNFIVNGFVLGTGAIDDNNFNKLRNKYFIYGKFSTRNTMKGLESIFSWRCDSGVGTDGTYCPRIEGNPYRNASFVMIDQNYTSQLIEF